MTPLKTVIVRTLLGLFVGSLLCLSLGCGQHDTDASDSDPHYYKGNDFAHKRRG